MTKAELMQKVQTTIDRRGDEIIALGETIRRQPELGFKEFKTAKLVAQTFERMGLTPRTGLALTGVRADVAGRAGDGPTLALFGELDGLVVVGHPVADPETGAAHACGHNAQVAGMLGAAMALLEAGAFDHLAGRVAFVGVPAEEYGDVEWRVAQRDAGRLEFMGGKPEMLRLGHLDDVDMGMMIHATPRREEGKLAVPMSNNGCVVKTVRYVGRASHAGGAPHLGVNALYAANIGLMAINALRETFRDEDTIRVHPIITHGGSQVNVIPGEVRLETFVRGKSLEAIADADRKVDRALRAGALALGATVEIETLPGYMPLRCDPLLVERFRAIAADLVGADNVRTILHRTGSTDMGDLGQVMPIIHPYVGGAKGTPHGADYEIVDPALTYLTNAKALASMVIDLLADNATVGRQVVASAKPPLTRDGYLAFQRKMSRRETYDGAAPDR
jgi:amidohydrolase